MLELLAIAIRREKDIKGIYVGPKEIKITMLADDITLFLKDPQSIYHVLDFLKRFRRYSGLKINKEKSHFLSLGVNSGKHFNDIPIQCCNSLKILGIKFSNNRSEENHYEWNYKGRMEKCQIICNDWRNRTLSLKGKVTVVNSLITSIMLYPATTTPVPERVFAELKKMVNRFIWGSDVNRVAYQTLCLSIEDGGLKLLDLACMVKAAHIKWVKRLCLSDHERWTMFPRHVYNVKTSLYHKFLAKQKKCCKSVSSRFYRNVLESWLEVYYCESQTEKERQNESLWGNDFITLGDTSYWEKWAKAGIVQVYDIVSNNSLMSTAQIESMYGIKCNFLQLLQIRCAIPWKGDMTLENLDLDPMCLFIRDTKDETQNLSQISSKMIYSITRKKFFKTPTAQVSWEKQFPKLTQNSELWKRLYVTAFKCTRETKLQALQFKIYHRIIPCNYYLFKRKGIDSPDCNFCGMEDDILHFFLHCPGVAFFWTT